VFYTMPLALIAIGSELDPARYEVIIVDGRIDPDPEKTLARHLPEAVCLGVTVLTGAPIADALRVSRAAKKMCPLVPVVWGGWHPSMFGRECLRERMRRKIRLHDHFTRQIGAPGAPRHLEQERGQPFGRAEIAAVEGVVGAEHADQSEPRKIVSLGEHLRSDEDVDVSRVDAIENAGEGPLALRAVAVDAHDARSRECGGQRALEALRAVPEGYEVDVAAVGTCSREPLDVAAMMAAQIRGFAVDDEAGAATRAAGLPAARRAEEREREPAAVDEDQRLLASIEPCRERRQ